MSKEDEMVLVVPKETLPGPSDGILIPEDGNFEQLVLQEGLFLRRGDVEEDPNYKQIIPYLIFRTHRDRWIDRYFYMRRSNNADPRLKYLYTLGIGGHVKQGDLDNQGILGWARREFEEEVDYQGSFTGKAIGLINDNSIPVNRVHTGYVILLEGDSGKIEAKSDEHTVSGLKTLRQMNRIHPRMESWSQFVFNHLNK